MCIRDSFFLLFSGVYWEPSPLLWFSSDIINCANWYILPLNFVLYWQFDHVRILYPRHSLMNWATALAHATIPSKFHSIKLDFRQSQGLGHHSIRLDFRHNLDCAVSDKILDKVFYSAALDWTLWDESHSFWAFTLAFLGIDVIVMPCNKTNNIRMMYFQLWRQKDIK